MSKHTPGPWGIEKTEEVNWVGPLRADGKVATVVAPFESGKGYKPAAAERLVADAQLIALAPEMLALLEEIAQGYPVLDAAREAKALIAKAKGEP